MSGPQLGNSINSKPSKQISYVYLIQHLATCTESGTILYESLSNQYVESLLPIYNTMDYSCLAQVVCSFPSSKALYVFEVVDCWDLVMSVGLIQFSMWEELPKYPVSFMLSYMVSCYSRKA